MHNIHQNNFSAGWNPSADELNAAPGSLLRADNLVWDEQGQPTLRRGLVQLFDLDTAILSLYTADIQGNRRRLQGGNNGYVYLNGVQSVGPFNGEGDIVFGGAVGQVFMARGTVKKKWDTIAGTGDIKNWGINPNTQQPTLTGILPPSMLVDSGQVNAWSTTGSDGTISGDFGHNANAAVRLTTNTGTRRGVTTKFFGGVQDFSGNPEDVIELYIATNNPDGIESIQLAFDVYGSTNFPFGEDVFYYDYTLENSSRVEIDDQFIALDPNVEGEKRRAIVEGLQRTTPITSRTTSAVATGQFVKISAPRSTFLRQGGTPGRDWNTVYAVRVAVQFALTDAAASTTTTPDFYLTFDTITIGTGRLTGTYFCKVQYVNQLPGYTAKSAVTPASEPLTVKNGNIQVDIPPSSDSQITEAWVFLLGGTLDRYYRFAVGQPGQTVTIATSEREALVDNITFNRYITTPPGDIIDILDGLHYGRMLVLTEYQLYPSQPNDPDAFATNEQIRVGEAAGAGERNVWIARTLGGVYIGTTRDIYRLDGTGDEPIEAGDFIGFRVIPLHVESPPVGQGAYPIGAVRAVATEGHTLVYMAADGPREFNGVTSVPLRGWTDLLWKWRDRYGIQKVDYNGRIRLALNFGLLYIMVSEGTASASVSTVYRLDMARGAAGWSRFTFAGPRNITTLYKEKAVVGSAGSIVMAGDENGRVYWMEGCEASEGVEGAIPVEVWPPQTDNGQPLHRKDAMDMQCSFEADTNPATIGLYLDRKTLPAITMQATAQRGERQAYRQILAGRIDPFIRAQFRLSGMFTKFRLYHFGLSYRLRPQLALARDTGYLDLSHGDLVWIRQAYVRLWAPVDMRVIAYLDDVAFEASTIIVEPGVVKKYRVDFGRTAKGTQLRVLVFPVVKDAVGVNLDPAPATPTSPLTDTGARIDEFSRMDGASNAAAFRSRSPSVGFFAPDDGSGRAPSYPTGFFDGQESAAFELYDIRVQIRQTGNWTEKLIFRNTQPEERNG